MKLSQTRGTVHRSHAQNLFRIKALCTRSPFRENPRDRGSWESEILFFSLCPSTAFSLSVWSWSMWTPTIRGPDPRTPAYVRELSFRTSFPLSLARLLFYVYIHIYVRTIPRPGDAGLDNSGRHCTARISLPAYTLHSTCITLFHDREFIANNSCTTSVTAMVRLLLVFIPRDLSHINTSYCNL